MNPPAFALDIRTGSSRGLEASGTREAPVRLMLAGGGRDLDKRPLQSRHAGRKHDLS